MINRRRDNLIGHRFNRLTVIGDGEIIQAPCGEKRWHWRCRCDCGNETLVSTRSLKDGRTKSCGCLSVDSARERHTVHGMRGSSEYSVWVAMRSRCLNSHSKDYRRYGAAGITVCDRWGKFENFLADMGPRPSLLYSIDRIDNSRGYEPGNCRWATDIEQANNRTNTRYFEWNGQRCTLSELAKSAGLSTQVMYARLVSHGWPIDRAMTEPMRPVC